MGNGFKLPSAAVPVYIGDIVTQLIKQWDAAKVVFLTPWQSDHYDSVSWLFDPTEKFRGEGRSQLMAVVYIDMAFRNPGCWIRPLDHAESTATSSLFHIRQNMMDMIKNVLTNHGLVHPFQFKQFDFRFIGY